MELIQLLKNSKDDVRFSQIDRKLSQSIGYTAKLVRENATRKLSDEQQKVIRTYLRELGKRFLCA